MKFIRTIHPFPARMASEVVWNELPQQKSPLKVLDPMAGSGTTLVTARLRGHEAIGFDRDPLAVLISGTWVSNIDGTSAEKKGKQVLARAQSLALKYNKKKTKAYPANSDVKTRKFIRYWFDRKNRVQLTALAETISKLRDPSLKSVMWCAFSRLIITKKVGVSLAMDISHSRPHRKYNKAPITPFDSFLRSVKQIVKASPFSTEFLQKPKASVQNADARDLPVKTGTIDVVITSPPYLNAIDYIRGHKLSLVWMGYTIDHLRDLRATNIGTEAVLKSEEEALTNATMEQMCLGEPLSQRDAGMLKQYIQDTKKMLSEIARVLRPKGKAVIVVGDCNLKNTFVRNSRGIEIAAKAVGLKVHAIKTRPLPTNRRYLPPPSAAGAGKALKKRMSEEVILTLLKPK